MGPPESIFRPTTGQRETPGTIGLQDSASPDRPGNSRFTPGPAGTNDQKDWSNKSEIVKRIRKLDNILQDLDKSRRRITETEYNLQNLSMGTKLPGKLLALWTSHNEIFRRFCLLLEEYLKDFHDHRDQANTGDLIGLILREGAWRQKLSVGDISEYRAALATHNIKETVAKLSVIACQKAYDIYRNQPNDVNKKTVVLRASDAQMAAEMAGLSSPREVEDLINKLAKEVAQKAEKAQETEKAKEQFILDFVDFVKKRLRKIGGPALSESKEDVTPPKQKKLKKKQKTWVEVKVVWSETGKQVPNVRLRITNPDGIENFHTTNSQGMIRIDGIDPGDCEARSVLNNPKLSNTLGFVKLETVSEPPPPVKPDPENPSPKRTGVQQIALIEEHKVKTGESLNSIAKENDLTWQELAKFNWGTDVPKEINEHLRDDVGCTKKTTDGNNYKFDDSDDPGIIYIPANWEEAGLATVQTHIVRVFYLHTGENPAFSIPAAVFSFDSAFPGPGVREYLKWIEQTAEQRPSARLAAFGHADPTGSDTYNKKLSDRRAKAIVALLTHNLPLFDELAETEAWGLRQYQAMLRGLGCNPSSIDGIDGPLTEAAVRGFQADYNDDVFHHGESSRAYSPLQIDGMLGPKTKAALRDAYIALVPVTVSSSRFAKPGHSGCSEFNLISDKDAENRRVTVAFITKDQPRNGEFPCTEGNASACPVDDQKPMRCEFYRRFFREKQRPMLPWFFDFQWLREDDEVAHLSALTPLPDGTPAEFKVYRCEGKVPTPPPASWEADPRPSLGPVVATLEATIIGGVCYARWRHPQDYDPFVYETWLVDHDIEIEVFEDDDTGELNEDDPASGAKLRDEIAIHPPLFSIEADGHWGFSSPPGKRLDRCFFSNEPSAEVVALLNDGSLRIFSASSGKIEEEDELEILSLVVEKKDAEVEPNEGITNG